MNWFKLIALSFLALVLQTSLFGPLSISGVRPDLLLILVVVYSLENGYDFGAGYGLVVGICMDLVGVSVLGANALAKTLLGTGLGSLRKLVFEENIILKIVLVFAASFINDLIVYLVQILMNQRVSAESLHLIIFPAALYNMIIAAFFITYSHWAKKR